MPGGTPWGQAQLRIFDRKFLPALKITKLVFFFLLVMKLFPEILIHVLNLFILASFTDNMKTETYM